MKTLPLYRYTRSDGGITTSLIKPSGEYTEMVRLVADEGKELIKNGERVQCVDVDSIEGWTEVEATTPSRDEITDTEALQIITGGAT